VQILTQDFFQATQETIRDLNKTDRGLFDHVVKNMSDVSQMSIQKLAKAMFVSTTTIFRFTQKLGFAGYTDFINSLLVTVHSRPDATIPSAILRQDYSEEYLKNAMETVRVMPAQDI